MFPFGWGLRHWMNQPQALKNMLERKELLKLHTLKFRRVNQQFCWLLMVSSSHPNIYFKLLTVKIPFRKVWSSQGSQGSCMCEKEGQLLPAHNSRNFQRTKISKFSLAAPRRLKEETSRRIPWSPSPNQTRSSPNKWKIGEVDSSIFHWRKWKHDFFKYGRK